MHFTRIEMHLSFSILELPCLFTLAFTFESYLMHISPTSFLTKCFRFVNRERCRGGRRVVRIIGTFRRCGYRIHYSWDRSCSWHNHRNISGHCIYWIYQDFVQTTKRRCLEGRCYQVSFGRRLAFGA